MQEDGAHRPPIFPAISDACLQHLFPDTSIGTSVAGCVRAALTEMELSYQLDPCLLNEKSDTNRGYWALADFVRRGCAAPRERDRRAAPAEHVPSEAPRAETVRPVLVQRAKTYAVHDVYAAIDKMDLDTIMAIRDKEFVLLLGGSDDVREKRTPLEHAISLGPRYERMSLFLAGSMSRFVNHLPEDRPLDNAQQAALHKVRTNLKLAIDHSLDKEQTGLLASYLQILVMSQGIAWIEKNVKAVERELHACFYATQGALLPQPTAAARDTVSYFLTHNLRTRCRTEHLVIATMDDYIANAASDLVLLALWDLVRGTRAPLPLYAFARDDRITGMFLDAVRDPTTRPHGPAGHAALRFAEAQDAHLRRHSATERFQLLEKICRQGAGSWEAGEVLV
ncbi:hypothetical protein MVES1_001359 [Malassezia vespertilionis]|uniref:Uncharacterized protein n=1 Tax=Malassezia vespertilionis TaxID=2020962 RepID=A0A2N1JE75_9BASI|nr:uncharacterized protein MVES1_001359 [Malassezia vespertilionis]PKI84857.1 hypothetical protein MVES_001275 [Malassezia vespertilionis]WFD06021.1 hypothetical protein MVES1_001359 [Malassezia vespertilionis]